MKIYEAITKNQTKIQCDDFHEDSYLNIEWSYIISLPVWVPLAIVGILFVLFFPKSLFQSFRKVLRRIFSTSEGKPIERTQVETIPTESMKTTERACVPIKKVLKRPTVICKTNNFNESLEDRCDSVEKVQKIILNVREANSNANLEFSEAYKYLCTCLPGNRILARRPIRCNRLSKMKINEN